MVKYIWLFARLFVSLQHEIIKLIIMKKLAIIVTCLLLVGAAVWYFMMRRDGDAARDVLPKDASAAMVFEPSELVSELGINLKDILKVASIWGDAEGTVDFSKPIYGFTIEDGVSGFSLNVDDSEKLLKLLTSFGLESEEKDGFWWVANKSYIACLDKDKLLVMTASTPQQDALRGEMTELMTQSRQDVPALEKAQKKEGIVRASTAMSNIPKQYAMSLPDDIDLSKAILNYALRIEKKALVYAAELESADNLSIPLAPIKGDLTSTGGEEPFAWLCVNMKGEELLPYLRKVDMLRSALLALNMCVDADMMIKAIDGDVMLAMPKLDISQTLPGIVFTATLRNTDFLKNADNWEQVGKLSANDFVMKQDGMDIFFGVRDSKLYISNSKELASKACQETNAADFQEAAKGKYLSASLNLKQLFEAVAKRPSPTSIMLNMPQIREAVGALDRISLNANSQQSFELSVETNKPVKDIYKNLIGILTGK